MKKLKLLVLIEIAILAVSAGSLVSRSFGQSSNDNVWIVHDTIDPTLEGVRWQENGIVAQAPSWITDGRWLEVSTRENLVSPNDIFVSMYELFNWSLVKTAYNLQFATFDDFTQYLVNNPDWWLEETWLVDTSWYGIATNTTGISWTFNQLNSEAQLWTWYHITRIPEYFVGSERLSNWLVGFDLTPISIGNLEIYQFSEDTNQAGSQYNLYFKAPANILTQHSNNYTLTLGVNPLNVGRTLDMDQWVDVNMPADTEIKETSPSNMSLRNGNTATFVISKDDSLPTSFTVVSGSPSKSFSQVVWESTSIWLLTPGGWAAMASLVVLSYTAFRGRRIWGRSKLYHRMYKSMVTVFNLYSSDIMKFHQEMATISSSIFNLLIADKITDEQFEKLLVRRDDLVKRVQGEPPKP
jgi:hypothetical protein